MSLIIVSGGQTGMDRAALDVAIHLGLQHRGWCPKNRKAENGVIDSQYNLSETESEDYEERTLLNIRDSDATLVVVTERCDVQSISDGTKLTVQQLIDVSKPYIVVTVSDSEDQDMISLAKGLKWLAEVKPKVLNIAGPRESTVPGIHDKSYHYLKLLLARKQLSLYIN